MVAALILIGIGSAWMYNVIYDPEKAEPKSSPLTKSKAPPTLNDLFRSDFPNVMKFRDEGRIGIQWKNGDILRIESQIYADFSAKTQFVGYYIPSSSNKTYEACLKLVDAVQETIQSFPKRVGVWAGYRDERTKIEELTFSGRVLLYHGDFLLIKQKAAIIEHIKQGILTCNSGGLIILQIRSLVGIGIMT
jgi:hypothetical protein